MSPEQIQEYLFYALGIAFPVVLITNLTYNLVIGGFFTELEAQDPQAWEKLGSPSRRENFRRIDSSNVRMLAFVPVLRAKAARSDYPKSQRAWRWFKAADYPKSQRAWRWFKAAAVATGTLFLLASALVLWSLLNDLY